MGRLLLLCSKRFPGSKRVLENLKAVLKETVECDIEFIESFLSPPMFSHVKYLGKIENKILSKLSPIRAEKVFKYGNNIIFAGWDKRYEIILSKLNREGITPSLILCSTLGQNELTGHEIPVFLNIHKHLKAGNLKYVLLNKRLNESLGKVLNNALYFPYTIDLHRFDSIQPKSLEGINIDLFCALRPGKNILNQILAFKMSGINGSLHININNPQIDEVIKVIGASVVKHRWLEPNDYYSLIAAMTASLQVTFTESFSYAVCERMCLGIPVFTSYDIDLISDDEFLARFLCINALDTPLLIANALNRLINDRKLRDELAVCVRKRIETIARTDNKYAIDCIRTLFK